MLIFPNIDPRDDRAQFGNSANTAKMRRKWKGYAMPQEITAYMPMQSSSACIAGARRGTEENIEDAIAQLREAMSRCAEIRFVKLNDDGNSTRDGKVDLSDALLVLERLEREVPRFMMLPRNRRRTVELVIAITKTVERFHEALQLLRQAGTATKAATMATQVLHDQWKLIKTISEEIPDESQMFHIRNWAHVLLLALGIAAAAVLNVFALGLPVLVLFAVSVAPSAAAFLWNRIYDLRTTPCAVWKPLRDLVAEIRHSLEISNMWSTSVVNRLEPQIQNLRSEVDTLHRNMIEPQIINRLEFQINKLESQVGIQINKLESEVGTLRAQLVEVGSGFQRLVEENGKLTAVVLQLLNRQAAVTPTGPNPNEAANDAALHLAQMG